MASLTADPHPALGVAARPSPIRLSGARCAAQARQGHVEAACKEAQREVRQMGANLEEVSARLGTHALVGEVEELRGQLGLMAGARTCRARRAHDARTTRARRARRAHDTRTTRARRTRRRRTPCHAAAVRTAHMPPSPHA
eukprot:2091756-Prymnesium_polylepis.1